MTRVIAVWLCCVALTPPSWAAPNTFDIQNDLPPVVEDSTKVANCTVTYLVNDIASNDTIAVRMQIAPGSNDRPVNDLMPCPEDIPPRVASRALNACVTRAADPKDCVFADMGRDFDKRRTVDGTTENSSRCASDKASYIGMACWRSGDVEICGVGCGGSPDLAVSAAVGRCEAKHQRLCPITGSLPVLAPR
jgi:hypothetical protein